MAIQIPSLPGYVTPGNQLSTLQQANNAQTMAQSASALNQPNQGILGALVATIVTKSAVTAGDVVTVPHNLGYSPSNIVPILTTSLNDGWSIASTPSGGNTKSNIYVINADNLSAGSTFSFLVF